MKKSIKTSIEEIEKRIVQINVAKSDFNSKLIPEKYYIISLKLFLIEIGEEAKVINDFLLETEGNWDEIISKAYNLRVSLTHYYKKINKELILNHIESDFIVFINKILELKKNIKKWYMFMLVIQD